MKKFKYIPKIQIDILLGQHPVMTDICTVLDFNEKLIALTAEHEPLTILTQMQNYLAAVLSGGNLSRAKQYEFIKHLKTIENAKKEFAVNMNPQTIFETLSLNMVL